MNVKKAFLFLLAAAILFPLSAQERDKDIVLVVDTSSSMFAWYDEVGTYLSGPFLAENLATGDTLHIISFGSKPRFEIARRILEEGDIETVSARIWLLYPLEPTSDSAAAIRYAEQYARSIQGGRPKKVFVVSGSDLSAEVNAARGRLLPNAEIQFIRAGSRMGSGTGTAGTTAPAGTGAGRTTASGTTAAGTSVTAAAGSSGTGVGSSGADSGSPGSGANGDLPAAGDSVFDQTTQGATPDGTQSPGGGGTAAEGAGAGSGAVGSSGTQPNQGAASRTSAGEFNISSLPLPLLIGLGLLLLLLLIFIILRMRNLQSSPKKIMADIRSEGNVAAKDAELLNSYATRQAEASLQGPPHRRYHYKDDGAQFLTKPPMLNIFVEEQNTAIGRRNIHALKKGASYTVGGGNSDFLIFLVSFPPRLGRLYFDGTNCTFTPLKKEYFPDIGSTPVTECIGKPIRILSDKNYEVFFHFEPYKDPLIVLNQLLNSIRVPEPPSTGKDKRNSI